MSEKESVLHQFGKNAEKYVTSKIHAKGNDLAMVVEIARENQNGDLLDIATGGGHVANALAPLFTNVVALDLTPEMLESAKKFITSNGHTNVSLIQGDALNLPFPNQSFGTITCRIAPHHFPNVNQFIKEAFRVLKDNGLFILVDNVAPELDEYDHFYNFVEKKRDPSHVRAYKKSEWIACLEKEGFTIQTFSTFKKTFNFDVWCEMMDVPQQDKEELNAFMNSASKNLQLHFLIELLDGQVQSFQGQSMLLVASKGETH
ncbi:class I SAM-dependent methyltransferase [Ureibacillus sp. NPDC094379]